jgi:cell division protein FtsI/penicillin-binding protein 2
LLVWPAAPPPADSAAGLSAYLLVDASTQAVVEARWTDRERPVPIGSLIKPFTALAYARTHSFVYPTLLCRGNKDACWLPGGHGRVGLADAIAGSCNAYFHQLAQRTSLDAMAATLQWYGMRADPTAVTPAAMVGLGGSLTFAPASIVRAYLELVTRAGQPGVAPIVLGMMASARTGTGRGAGESIGPAGAFVKTGTAPCTHSPRAAADGYTIIVYPADRPRLVLLAQAHGRTGADTAALAGQLLATASGVR